MNVFGEEPIYKLEKENIEFFSYSYENKPVFFKNLLKSIYLFKNIYYLMNFN